jgi:hypothetical protein
MPDPDRWRPVEQRRRELAERLAQDLAHPEPHLIPAARAVRAALANDGRRLSRDALADAIRDGHGVSNERGRPRRPELGRSSPTAEQHR